MKNIFVVKLSGKAEKDITKIPTYIIDKLNSWIDSVKYDGIMVTRKVLGYHDELLKGSRSGQRSIRLSKGYRAIYIELDDGVIEFIEIQEVNKHDYRKRG